MDRLTRTLSGLGLALIATTAGCHNVRDEVPPHQKFRNDGKPDSPVEFSTQPHPPQGAAFNGPIGGAPGNAGPGGNPLNSSSSPGNSYGNLTSGSKFGAPSTSGLGQPPSLMAPPIAPPVTAPVYPPAVPARPESSGLIPGQPVDGPSPF